MGSAKCLFCGLYYDAGTASTVERRMTGRQMNDDMKGFGKKRSWQNPSTILSFSLKD
jgi:hypothetical protein